jgi:multidrug efflux pump subunit AcrA (membrane-fusion protein)
MKPRLLHAVIALMALIIAALAWTLIYFARDELRLDQDSYEEKIETGSTSGEVDGRAVVRVSAASQAASGIALSALQAAASEDFVEVYGSVVNIQPLLETRGRYLVALGDVRARQAALAAAKGEYQRMQLLYRDDRNVSEQAVRNAQARFRSESAQLAAAQAAVGALSDALRTAWGDTIAGWAASAESRALQSLLERRSHLIVLALPFDLPRAAASANVAVAPVIARERLRAARFVSDAPSVETTMPGQTFFYLADGADLRAGTRVVARVSVDGNRQSGILVPREAVVWHAGKSWVYVKQDAETFARHAVDATRELGNGWFNPAGDLKPGDEVVVSGAQLLLSEELKFQIRNENED